MLLGLYLTSRSSSWTLLLCAFVLTVTKLHPHFMQSTLLLVVSLATLVSYVKLSLSSHYRLTSSAHSAIFLFDIREAHLHISHLTPYHAHENYVVLYHMSHHDSSKSLGKLIPHVFCILTIRLHETW